MNKSALIEHMLDVFTEAKNRIAETPKDEEPVTVSDDAVVRNRLFVLDTIKQFAYEAPTNCILLGDYTDGNIYFSIKNILPEALSCLVLSLKGINSYLNELCLNRTADISHYELWACLDKKFEIISSTVGKCDNNLEISLQLKVIDDTQYDNDLTHMSMAEYLASLVNEVKEELLFSDFKVTSIAHTLITVKMAEYSITDTAADALRKGIHSFSTSITMETVFEEKTVKSEQIGYPEVGKPNYAIVQRSGVMQVRNSKLGLVRYSFDNCYWTEDVLDLFTGYIYRNNAYCTVTYTPSSYRVIADIFFPIEWQLSELFETLTGFEEIYRGLLRSYRKYKKDTANKRYKRDIRGKK